MRWSVGVGTVHGIALRLNILTTALLAVIGGSIWLSTGQATAAVWATLFFIALFGCVVLHEFGHALAALRYGIRTRDVTILPIGGVARLERMPDEPRQELIVALAGPAVNVMIAVVLAPLALWSGWSLGMGAVPSLSLDGSAFIPNLMMANLWLVGFNLVPAFPLDGGRVFRALLATRWGLAGATRVAAGVGQAFAALFAVVGFFSNPLLIFIAIFIWSGASQEVAWMRRKVVFSGIPVRSAMQSDLRVLRPTEPVSSAARVMLASDQTAFPVVADNNLTHRVVGMVTRQALYEAMKTHRMSQPVTEVMTAAFERLDVDETLENAITRLGASTCPAAPVYGDGRVVGMLTAQRIQELAGSSALTSVKQLTLDPARA